MQYRTTALSLILFATPVFAHALPPVRIVALSGAPALGAPNAAFTSFSNGELNNQGQVAFRATTNAPSGGQRSGVWSEGGGPLHPLALEGQQAPQTPVGTVFAPVSSGISQFRISLGDNGSTTILTQFVPGPSDVSAPRNDGIWSYEANGTVTLRMRSGVPLPGLASGVTARFIEAALAKSGAFVAKAPLSTGASGDFEDSEAVFVSTLPGDLRKVIQSGMLPPRGSAGTRFVYASYESVTEDGRVAFAASVGNSSGQLVNGFQSELWYERPNGTLAIAVRHGNSLPGIPAGRTFERVRNLDLNSQGQIIFEGQSTGNFPSPIGFWAWSQPTGPQLLAIETQSAPGLPGVVFQSLTPASTQMAWNEIGQTVFHAWLGGAGVGANNDTSIWRAGLDTPLQLVVREGDQAPGLPGLEFAALAPPANFPQMYLNNRSQFTFAGTVRGSGVSTSNDVAIWAEDVKRKLQLIAREGDLLNVGNNVTPDWRTISRLSFNNSTRPINDRGQVLFFATFTDGSQGIFVSNLVAVPEPTNLLLLSCLTVFALLPRRRRRLASGS